MNLLNEIIKIIKSVLNIDITMHRETRLLGDLPEFDSQAVIAIISILEEQLGLYIEDNEISAEVFETVGTMVDFFEAKI